MIMTRTARRSERPDAFSAIISSGGGFLPCFGESRRKILALNSALLMVLALLASGIANAGPFAPAPRVIAKYERAFIERTGSQTLEELLDTGILRYFLTGGQPMLVLINGRPYDTTSGDLDALTVSSIERIELLRGESLGTLGGQAVRGAINVVLRSGLDGLETRAVMRQPSKDGGDGRQGSIFWGGSTGDGQITLGVDVLDRDHIAARSREHSRAQWQAGGSFAEGKNISRNGNTVYIVKSGTSTVRSASIGDCQPSQNYTGPLTNPPGITSGDKGCGFAWTNIAWNTSAYDQRGVVLNWQEPVDESADFSLDANVSKSKSSFRYAPATGLLSFSLPQANSPKRQALLNAINGGVNTGNINANGNDLYLIGHRFVGHGNRDWHTENDRIDIAARVTGSLSETLGYDVQLNAYEYDGDLRGDTFVLIDEIKSEIQLGNYNLIDPFSTDSAHLEAIQKTSATQIVDAGFKQRVLRLALEGVGFSVGGRESSWVAGVEHGEQDGRSILSFRDYEGNVHTVDEVLGSGGFSYDGDRRVLGAFAEMSIPLTKKLDLRIAGRKDDDDNVGQLESWRAATFYQTTDNVTLHGSWSTGTVSPTMATLYAYDYQSHPYILCTYPTGAPPRTCVEANTHQIMRVTSGNTDLDPLRNKRIAFGAKYERWPNFLSMEWYRLSRKGLTGQISADRSVQTLEECGSVKSNCVEFEGGNPVIYDRFENIENTELTGLDARFQWGTRTDWGTAGMQGVWRHVSSAHKTSKLTSRKTPLSIPRNVVRLAFLARRGDWSVTWSTNYRSDFENASRTGTFSSWMGHDLLLDWSRPLGHENARFTAGVFNLTDAKLSVDPTNTNNLDGPTEATWGRTFFVTFNVSF